MQETVTVFLEELVEKVPVETKPEAITLLEFYKLSLWHQVGEQLLKMFNLDVWKDFHLALYESFISVIEAKLNPRVLILLVRKVSRLSPPSQGLKMVQTLESKLKPWTKEIEAMFQTTVATLLLQTGAVDEAESRLEEVCSEEPLGLLTRFRIAQTRSDWDGQWQNLFSYLKASDLEELPHTTFLQFFEQLAVSALESKILINFSEISESFSSVSHLLPEGHLFHLLQEERSIDSQNVKVLFGGREDLCLQGDLIQKRFHKRFLRALLWFIRENCKKTAIISLAQISEHFQVSFAQIENCLLECLFLKFLSGQLDQVQQTLTITSISPFILGTESLPTLLSDIEHLKFKVEQSLRQFS